MQHQICKLWSNYVIRREIQIISDTDSEIFANPTEVERS